jgi:hypothetical protein
MGSARPEGRGYAVNGNRDRPEGSFCQPEFGEQMFIETMQRRGVGRTLGWREVTSVMVIVAFAAAAQVQAQAPAASGNAVAPPATPEQLERLVGPIALYPDDLVAIILPASTNPLQLVQADRFLEKRKTDPKLPIDEKWDDSVKALVNYPEVVKQMSGDLDWTADLGEAVVDDQGAVLDAVQAFRRKAEAAGNLKTDAKQNVVVEKEVIKIVPADPQVIYVPQYNPATVVVYSAAPVYSYWPAPYPVYYYPYPPGAVFATGLIWGAAIGASWHGGYYGANWGGGNNNITINRGNVNINNGNINTGNINRGNVNTGNINRGNINNGAQSTAWKSGKTPGQVSGAAGRPTTTGGRLGDARPGGGATGASTRPSTQQAGSRPQNLGQGGAGQRPTGSGQSRDAFGGYGSGSAARADSSRGAASRSTMPSQGARPAGGSSAGSAHAGGAGGGGARAGGGGGGGGGRGGRR